MPEEAESSSAAILSGERFEELYQEYYSLVFALCKTRLADHDEALDAAQEVFLRKWRARSTYDPARASFRTWLSRNAEHLCTDIFRRKAVRPVLETLPEDPALVSTQEITDQQTVGRLALAKGLTRLTAQQRQLVLMHEVEGYTWEEIASLTGLTVGQARSGVAKGLGILRAFLLEQGIETDV